MKYIFLHTVSASCSRRMSFSRRIGTLFSTTSSHRAPPFLITAPPIINRSFAFKLSFSDIPDHPASIISCGSLADSPLPGAF